MPTPRRLVALTAVTLMALPGLALAQDGPPADTPTPEPPGVAQAQDDTPGEVQDEAQDENPAVAALAECLPSGRELHGTGLTKGRVVSQAARSGQVVLGDDAARSATTPAEASAICDVVQGLADAATAPDRARGRPDWAGPKDRSDGPPGLSEGRGRGAPAG